MNLTDKEYWDNSYSAVNFQDLNNHDIAIFLQQYLIDGRGKTSLEIGSFPGAIIPTIARRGFLVHGVDFNAGNSTDLPRWLKSLGIQVGNFWTADFLEFAKDGSRQFDLVCSFGFIEHFENYEEIIDAHMALVKPEGQLIITTPNFRGWMQYFPHRLFDNQSLQRHYLPSMCPDKWKIQIEKSGFEVNFAGYFGGYRFWAAPNQSRNRMSRLFLRLTERTISQIHKIFRVLKMESSAFSAFGGIVAVRPKIKP